MQHFVDFTPTQNAQRILCASCGTVIAPNPANMCINCIRNDVDITEGIPKQATVQWCRGCERYLQPPNIWVPAQLESKELLTLLLKKLKGLKQVRLVDAGFIWTEPHSRRIKLKLTIQKEVFASTILQQVFVVEYIVAYQQCEECTRVAAQLTWKAAVQVRQKVLHKKTFFWLEQLILKHNAHKDTTNIKEAKDGIDFYYVNKGHAIKMVEFLSSVVPIRMKTSEQLISSDIHSGTSNYKFTYSVEIVPICKDDLICLPRQVAKSMGNISPLVLCTRVSNVVQVMDPNSLKIAEFRANSFFESPFGSLCEAKDLIDFYVIDVEIEQRSGKYALAYVQVALASNLSVTFGTRTHLGSILNPGDHASGYLLHNSNFNNEYFDDLVDRLATSSKSAHLGGGIPDVVLVKKSYPNSRRKPKNRNWRLKKLAAEKQEDSAELDYELFLRDLEEDKELRQMVNLYKTEQEPMQEEDDDDELPPISVDELLTDMQDLEI